MQKLLDNILNTPVKVKILRLLTYRPPTYLVSGREIARLIHVSAPTAHAALKELYNTDILQLEIISRNHIYRLNIKNRTVKDIIIPMFKKEESLKQDIITFIKKQITSNNIKKNIISLILYGSFQTETTTEKSDIDIAIIAESSAATQKIEKTFSKEITDKFHDYFGIHLDIYIKTKEEFIERLKKNLPPVSTLIKSYYIIYGKDPLDLK
ncbi:MAG: nucleotidyltransferase domain-containing protein [Candidatus Omnitrophota bacterium]|nr:nucleotidyltransferase domain-containing protein [Candidatus Omnitrophota bacterium]